MQGHYYLQAGRSTSLNFRNNEIAFTKLKVLFDINRGILKSARFLYKLNKRIPIIDKNH